MAILPRDGIDSDQSAANNPTSQQQSTSPSATSSNSTTLLTITAVGSILCLVALIVLVYFSISRRRLLAQQIKEESNARHPYNKAQGMMTVEDLDWGEEVMRAAIIRKTVASRGESHARAESRDSNFSGFTDISLNSHHRPGTASSATRAAKTDWKDIEAGGGSLLQPSTPSRLNHPTLPDIAVVNSPTGGGFVPVARSPLSPLTGEVPPPIEEHPCARIKEMGE